MMTTAMTTAMTMTVKTIMDRAATAKAAVVWHGWSVVAASSVVLLSLLQLSLVR